MMADHIFQSGADTIGYISPPEAETTDCITIDMGKRIKSLRQNLLF